MKPTEQIPQELLKKIKSLNWYRHGIYTTNLFQQSSCLKKLGKEWFAQEWLDKSISNLISLGEQVFLTEDEFEEISNIMLEKIKNEPNYLKKYIEDYEKDNDNFLKVAEDIKNKFNPGMSNEELSSLLSQFLKASDPTFHWLWSMEFLNPAIDKFIKIKVKEWQPSWDNEKIDEFLTSISYTSKKLPFQIEKEESLNIDLENPEVLKKMHEKYAWFNMYFWDGRPFMFEEYKTRLIKIAKDEITKRDVEDFEEKSKEAEKLIQSTEDKNLKELLRIVQDLIFLKTERIDVYTIAWYKVLDLIDKIAKRLNISYDQLLRFTSEEILSFLKGEPIPEDFEKRKKFVCLIVNDKFILAYGRIYDQIKEILKKDFSQVKEIKGTTGYKGIVKGIARVLMDERELQKLQKDDILICNLTNPNYNPAFEIISGVVTDEGGILCHSAIMAREFKLPCVIGTKIATQVFKDGDLIEVDANHGIVKILKKIKLTT